MTTRQKKKKYLKKITTKIDIKKKKKKKKKKLKNAFENNILTDIKLSKTQMSKIIQSGGF